MGFPRVLLVFLHPLPDPCPDPSQISPISLPDPSPDPAQLDLELNLELESDPLNERFATGGSVSLQIRRGSSLGRVEVPRYNLAT